jgi:predicted transcriptional regulator
MDSEIKKVFQISGYLLRSFANGLESIARQIESLTQPPADQEPEAKTRSGTEPPETSHSTDARSAPETGRSTKTEIIMDVIAGAEEGVDVDAIVRKTGFDRNTIRSAASRLRKQGKVKSKKKGVYMSA